MQPSGEIPNAVEVGQRRVETITEMNEGGEHRSAVE